MTEAPYRAKAYLLLGCPFCFKFLLFMTEAGLLEQIEVIELNHNDSDYEARKLELARLAGKAVSFPLVEVAPGHYESETDALIDRYSQANQVSKETLPTLDFYSKGVFENLIGLYKENMKLKSEINH